MDTTQVQHYVFNPNSMHRLMEKDAVCRLEWPWFGRCLATTVL